MTHVHLKQQKKEIKGLKREFALNGLLLKCLNYKIRTPTTKYKNMFALWHTVT